MRKSDRKDSSSWQADLARRPRGHGRWACGHGRVGAAIAASQDRLPGHPRSSTRSPSTSASAPTSSRRQRGRPPSTRSTQALQDGKITEEQAEELKSRIESGELPPFFGPDSSAGPAAAASTSSASGWARASASTSGTSSPPATDYLGVTEEELREALRNGRSLADVAKAEGKSVDGLKQAILGDARSRLDEAVADEKLTQEQADAISSACVRHRQPRQRRASREPHAVPLRAAPARRPSAALRRPPGETPDNGAEPGDAAA